MSDEQPQQTPEKDAYEAHAFIRQVERKPSEGPCDLCGLPYPDPVHGGSGQKPKEADRD